MMDWTDRHCRYFLRLLSPSAFLYTEMVTATAIHHGDKNRLLRFDPAEHPVALQLGGSDPHLMAGAAALGARLGYDEININVGCPSDRVKSGRFGACLMARPTVVADCFRAMHQETDVPVSVKTRLGIDDHDDYRFLLRFVEKLREAGCRKFVVHARKALLSGLSPKENRTIPPLNYERVFRLKRDFPDLDIVLNGGITDIAGVDAALESLDGAMIGRQAYHHPYFLAELERHVDPDFELPTRSDVVEAMLPYVDAAIAEGVPLGQITRHMLGLFAGQPGARLWRRHISENAHRAGAGSEVLVDALSSMPPAAEAVTIERPMAATTTTGHSTRNEREIR